MTHKPLTLADHAVLGLLAEQPRHGWAVVRELAPDGALGRIWSLSRPLAYRALDGLVARRLVRATGSESGLGPRRTIYAPTATGRRALDRWLAEPVHHLRDVRTELLIKLALNRRMGRELHLLLRAQQHALQPIETALDRAAANPTADFVDRWRRESAESVRRFLDDAIRAECEPPA